MSVQSEALAQPLRSSASSNFRVGVGSGFAGDRFDAAKDLIERVDLDALVFECLAERTIGLAQLDLLTGRGPGFDGRVVRRVQDTIQQAVRTSTVIITNGGAANPRAAGEAIRQAVEGATGRRPRVAVVTGDDVLERLDQRVPISPGDDPLERYRDRVVSANAYLGAPGLVAALETEPDVIVTGRVSDAALFLAPLVHHFGWAWDDYDAVASGTTVGHLLECAGQLTGGYFADGRRKQVEGLARLGFPFATVEADGTARLEKTPDTGGRIDRMTCIEQLLYEVTDPYGYLTPDVTVDMSSVSFEQLTPNGPVLVQGAKGVRPPETLKVSVGVRDGYKGIGEISYAGEACLERAVQAAGVIRDRWETLYDFGDIQLDAQVVGVNSCRPWREPEADECPAEVRLRMATCDLQPEAAVTLANEVEALYTNGPAGGGGVFTRVEESLGVISTLIPRSEAEPRVEVLS